MTSNVLRFWFLLIVLIPSFLCSLFVSYNLLFQRALRKSLNNHPIVIVIIIGLISEITLYPWMLYYYYRQGDWERPMIFCQIWGFFDWGFYTIHTVIFAWATIERHILIFHDGWLSTKNKRLIIHFLPLILVPLYFVLYYFVVIFIPPCNNISTPLPLCISFCLLSYQSFATWEVVAHQFIPNIITVISSIALFIRVFIQKYRMHQSVQWHKHRRMGMQVLAISMVYFIFAVPLTILYFIMLINPLYPIDMTIIEIILHSSYYVILLIPFVCILSMPELKQKLFRLLNFRQRRIIVPSIANTLPNRTQHFK